MTDQEIASRDVSAGAAAARAVLPLRGARFWLLVLSVIITLSVPGILLAAPALFRGGMVSLETAMWRFSDYAFYLSVAGAAASLLALAANAISPPRRGVIIAVFTLTACVFVGFRIYAFRVERASLPPIHDVQTDWNQPVAFTEKLLEARELDDAAPVRDDAWIPDGEGRWSGRTFAGVQREVYDLKPLLVGAPPGEATVAVAEAAERLGWVVVRSDPPGGVVEAVNYSFWYGLTSDIAVRVLPQGNGSRIDVRSASRTAGSDMGANAARVKGLVDEVSFALRGSGEPGGVPVVKDPGS